MFSQAFGQGSSFCCGSKMFMMPGLSTSGLSFGGQSGTNDAKINGFGMSSTVTVNVYVEVPLGKSDSTTVIVEVPGPPHWTVLPSPAVPFSVPLGETDHA